MVAAVFIDCSAIVKSSAVYLLYGHVILYSHIPVLYGCNLSCSANVLLFDCRWKNDVQPGNALWIGITDIEIEGLWVDKDNNTPAFIGMLYTPCS